MTELDTFRTEVRSWLESNVPASLRGRPMAMAYESAGGEEEPANIRADRARFSELMVSRGFTAPTWPKQYGGGGLSAREARVLQEELARLKLAPAMASMGLTMIGPTLLVHGTEAQKQEFLPKIVTGEQRWCQGFSEPGAGSDLASLRCAAKLDPSGQRYVINGSKIWTSGAHLADWIFMLVRTDDSSKHNGITFILVDMKTPGIEVKPIRLIHGHSMFCEVFFNDVGAEAKNVVGAVDQGWTVAKTLLNFERSGMGTGNGGSARRGSPNGGAIVALAKETIGEEAGKLADSAVRDQLASLLIDELALSLTIRRSVETQKQTGAPGPEISMFKLCQSELGQRRDELLLRVRGTSALGWEGPGFSSDDLALTRAWLGAKATTIFGGTSEIQRNIIAKRVLKLPSGN
jgi:alkylation response protein AidB-like acyl-CoA dehydrogenase